MGAFVSLVAIISTATIVSMQSCERKPLEHVPVTENVTFEKDIKPITLNACIQCHSGGSRNFSNYINAYTYRHTIYRRVVVSKDMPLGKYLSDEERALFRDWVNQGAKKD